MPCLMHKMRITGYTVDLASDPFKFFIFICQVFQLCGAHKREIRRIEEKYAPLSKHIRLGYCFKISVHIGLDCKISDFFVDQ